MTNQNYHIWEQLPDGRCAYLRQMAPVREEWVNDAGKWYYLGADGAMLAGTTTPDGYSVDATGAWVA